MVVLQMDHEPASIGGADAARREAGAPRREQPSPERLRRPADAVLPVGALPAAVVAQLEDARRRVALRAAMLGVFGTLSGAWLGANLPNSRKRTAPAGARPAGCTSLQEGDRFAH